MYLNWCWSNIFQEKDKSGEQSVVVLGSCIELELYLEDDAAWLAVNISPPV